MSKALRNVVVTAMLFVAPSLYGQPQPGLRRIQGPGNQEITSIKGFHRDSQGYLWIVSSSEGLLQYDGRNFRQYKAEQLVSSEFNNPQFASLVFEDRDGTVWIGTNGGALMRFDRQMDQFHVVNDSTTSQNITLHSYALSPDGGFWIGSIGGGLAFFHPRDKRYRHYISRPGDLYSLPDNYVTGLVYDQSGKLWIGTTSGLCIYDEANDRFDRVELPNVNPNDNYRFKVIRNMIINRTGKLCIATYGGLHVFDIKTRRGAHYVHQPSNNSSLPHNSLFMLAEDSDGYCWIASYGGGLSKFDPDTEQFTRLTQDLPDGSRLPGDNLFSLYLDGNNLLWIGGADQGLSVMHPRGRRIHSIIHRTSKPEGISAGWVRTVLSETDSTVWLGFNGSGLNRLNLRTGNAERYVHDPHDPHSLGHNSIISMRKDSRGRLWLGLEGGGVNVFEPDSKRFIRMEAGPGSISNNAVAGLFVDSDDWVWVTAYRSGLNVYRPDVNRFQEFRDDSLKATTGIALSNGHDMFELNNNIWFWNSKQIAVFDKTARRFVRIKSPVNNIEVTPDNVYSVYPYSNTEAMLITPNEIQLVQYTNPAEIQFRKLYDITDDRDSEFRSFVITEDRTIWYLAAQQVVEWNPGTRTRRIFGKADGLELNNIFGISKDKQERIFLTAVNGVAWFAPAQMTADTSGRKIVFSDFSLFNSRVAIGPPTVRDTYTLPAHISVLKEINLEASHNFFTISFSAMEYFSPDKVQYAYMLEGFDDDWIYIGNRDFASYTNLDPGQYTLLVKATNPDGFWGKQYATMGIIIHPPFWRTWWFMALSVAAISALILALHQYRLSQSLQVERLRNKIASDLHDEVGSSLTRISIFADLIKSDDNKDSQKDYLTKISSMSREIVDTMSDIVWSIDNRSDTLGALIFRMKDFALEGCQASNIELEFDTNQIDEDRVLTPALKQNIYLIFKESINNIIKHSSATRVHVVISNQKGQFELIVSDNGVGYGETIVDSGNGLRNMRRRATVVGADLSITSTQPGTTIHLSRDVL